MKCKECNSSNIIRSGKRKTRFGEIQRFQCQKCNYKFVERGAFKHTQHKSEVITLCLDLYFKGLSLRKVQHHLKQFYKTNVSHVTILNWIYKYTQIISSFTNKTKIKSSKEWNADETVLFYNKNPHWMWNVIDKNTKFSIAFQIAKFRLMENCEVFRKSKGRVQNEPLVITTDSYRGYPKLVQETFPKVQHRMVKGIQGREFSNTIERFHSSIKERTKVNRGFKSEKGAVILSEGWRNYYNFIRPHMTLDGSTPAERAGIDLKLGENKWLDLIQKSMKE